MSMLSYVALITVQSVLRYSVCTTLRVSKRIYCLSDNFIISPYVVSGSHYLLPDFFSLLTFFFGEHFFHVSPPEIIRDVRSGDPCGQKRMRGKRVLCLLEVGVSVNVVRGNGCCTWMLISP